MAEADLGKLNYRVQCVTCLRLFTIDDLNKPMPKHAPQAEWDKMPSYLPCAGSGTTAYSIIESFYTG